MFAMDATMSRQATWDMALGLQSEMFRAVSQVGGLDVQLIYFRGAGECRCFEVGIQSGGIGAADDDGALCGPASRRLARFSATPAARPRRVE